MKRLVGFFLLVLVALKQQLEVACTKSHPITTFIDAKWNVTPVALEIAEFLADENPIFYWKFIDELNALSSPLDRLESDAKQYKTVLRLAKKFLGESQIDLLKLTLSLRSLSPRIQAHLQIARDLLENTACSKDAFVVVGAKVICAFDDLRTAIQSQLKATNRDSVQQFNFDQIYPGSDANPVSVILYSQIGTASSKRFHEVLQAKAVEGEIRFINRHYVRNQVNQKVRLSGYGVELHMKSTEYKSQDDSPQQAGDEDQSEGAQEAGESEVNGFDFSVLK